MEANFFRSAYLFEKIAKTYKKNLFLKSDITWLMGDFDPKGVKIQLILMIVRFPEISHYLNRFYSVSQKLFYQ